MDESGGEQPTLSVKFYKSASGNEPVRDWLLSLGRRDRKAIGFDIKTAQYGWPIGMPLIRKLEPGMWEVRSEIKDGIARVLFTVEGGKTPATDLKMARQRLADLHKR